MSEVWLGKFHHRKQMNVLPSPDGSLTDYQMMLVVYRSNGIDGSGGIYIPSSPDVRVYSAPHSAYGTFLNTYGVWTTSEPSLAAAGTVTVTYYVNITTPAQYRLECSADNSMIVTINGTTAGSITGFTSTSNSYVTLPVGKTTIVCQATNNEGPASFGAALYNSAGSMIWNTRTKTAAVQIKGTGQNVYIGTHGCKSDYSDIRFTKADKVTLLPYWIESYNDDYAMVWVRFDSIPATNATTDGITADDGLYTYRLFLESGTFSPVVAGTIDLYVIGAGGGGNAGIPGISQGAAGAGGDIYYNATEAVTAGDITITIGAGGIGVLGNETAGYGGDTSFGSITASGGGGAYFDEATQRNHGGNNTNYTGGIGTESGGDGGKPETAIVSGGGGAGATGNATLVGGVKGGPGIIYDMSGIERGFGGGGSGTLPGDFINEYGGGKPGFDAEVNRGGGAGAIYSEGKGCDGGSGTVLIKYLTSSYLESPVEAGFPFFMYYQDANAVSLSNIDTTMDAGLRYYYYGGSELTSFSVPHGNDVDTNINHVWPEGEVTEINSNTWENLIDNVSMRYRGWIKPKGSGDHIFYETTEDAMRLYIIDNLTLAKANSPCFSYTDTIDLPLDDILISDWVNPTSSEHSATFNFDEPKRILFDWYNWSGYRGGLTGR